MFFLVFQILNFFFLHFYYFQYFQSKSLIGKNLLDSMLTHYELQLVNFDSNKHSLTGIPLYIIDTLARYYIFHF